MNKFFDSFLTLKGDKVDMSILEVIIYSLIPIFGQLLMRINKFGGSLDKPYLFFPILLIPPFSFIPTLIAKFGFLKKTNGVDMLDGFIIIPVIFKFILILFAAQIGQHAGVALQTGLILLTIFAANMISILIEERCKKIQGGYGGKLIKGLSDSMFQYGFAILLLFSTSFIPFIGALLRSLRNIAPDGKLIQVIDAIIWSFGLIFGYIFMNMMDTNYYTPTEGCKGDIGLARMIISIIAFAVALVYQFREIFLNLIPIKF